MVLIEPKLTYEHLAQLPDDGKRYELIDGELLVSAAPVPQHQRVIWNLVGILSVAEQAGYGMGFVAPLDVVFDDYSVAEPDLFFIVTERLHIVTDKIECGTVSAWDRDRAQDNISRARR